MPPEPGWLFRVASAKHWGGGHVSRCRSLAAALRQRHPVTFVLDSDDGGWREVLAGDGITVWRGDGLPGGLWRGSLIDGYGFSEADAGALREAAPPLVALDDLLSPPAAADLVVNAGVEDVNYGTPALLGPRYALVDQRFRGLSAPEIREEIAHVVATFGRFDVLNATGLALAALFFLARQSDFRSRLSVVLGVASPNIEDVRGALESWPGEARLFVEHMDMPGLLQTADLVLGAGGVGLYERMACGVPSVTLCLAENQAANIAVCRRHGATRDAGPIDQFSVERFADAVLSLARSRRERGQQSRRGQACVDGRGPERVADAMIRFSNYDAAKPSRADT